MEKFPTTEIQNTSEDIDKLWIDEEELREYKKAYPNLDEQVLEKLFRTESYFSHRDSNRRYSAEWITENEDRMLDPVDLIIKQGEAQFKIKEIIPPGCNLAIGKDTFYDIKKNTITVKKEDLNSKNFILLFLHEIGHSYQVEELAKGPQRMGIINMTKFIINMFKDFERENGKTISKTFGKEFSSLEPNENFYYYPAKLRNQILTKSAWAERNAWAYALVQIRKLKKMGIDIASSWENDPDKLRDLITFYLLTYDYKRVIKKPELLEEKSFHLKNRRLK